MDFGLRLTPWPKAAKAEFNEADHPRDQGGKFTDGSGGGSGTMGDMPSQSEYPKDKTAAAFKARADKINSYPDRDSEVHDAERQRLHDDMLAAGHTPKARSLADVAAGLSKTGGFTYSTQTGEVKSVGFAVSIAGHEKAVPLQKMSIRQRQEELGKYIEEHIEALTGQGNHFGGWVNPEDGMLYLDVSKVTNDIKEARRNAVAADQEAFYDFQTGSDVVIKKGAAHDRYIQS